MDLSQQKQQFSIAYVHALATACALKASFCMVDDESVDITLGKAGGSGTVRSPRLDIQLKCTERSLLRKNGLHFPLKRKNFDDLRAYDLMVPKILVVLLVPSNPRKWIVEAAEKSTSLFRCAWWTSLAGAPDRPGIATPTVILPRANRFDVTGLRSIMSKISKKESL